MRILLNGARGRMGQAIAEAADGSDCVICAAIDVGDDPAKVIDRCDAIVDFSIPSATLSIARLAANAGKALVIGTTGHASAEKEAIVAEARRVPTVWSGNFSVGINLLFHLATQAATALDETYDIEIVEMHHRMKKDAPSGTAERLIEILLAARGLKREQARHGRKGLLGERPKEEIGVHALRGGDVVGDHTVFFAGPGERIELTHRATSRKVFAEGALRAARWVVKQPPGIYNMQDVLGLQ